MDHIEPRAFLILYIMIVLKKETITDICREVLRIEYGFSGEELEEADIASYRNGARSSVNEYIQVHSVNPQGKRKRRKATFFAIEPGRGKIPSRITPTKKGVDAFKDELMRPEVRSFKGACRQLVKDLCK